MLNMSGVVEAVARSGKSLKIGDSWYSAFAASSLNGAKAGDSVSFKYTVTEKAGVTYNNIKGSVSITSDSPAASAASPAKASGGYAPKSARSFPVGPLDPERSIIRQNAMTQANNAMAAFYMDVDAGSPTTIEAYAEQVIEVAKMFEAYAAGDTDMLEAASAMEDIRKMVEA